MRPTFLPFPGRHSASTTFPPLPGKHSGFTTFAALAFALLYTETGVYSAYMAGRSLSPDTWLLLVAGFLLVGGGFGASWLLPGRQEAFPEGEFKDATPVLNYLIRQLSTGVALMALTTAATLVIYVYLSWPHLTVIANLLKDLFIYLMIGILYYQVVLVFVRYLNFLYKVKMDNALKVMVTEGVLALLTLVLGLYLLSLDVLRLSATPDPLGLVGLHVTVRAIWVVVIIVAAYGWHFKWVADH